MSTNLSSYLLLSLILFGLGMYGFLTRKNIISILISLELMLNAANLNFLAFGHFVVQDSATSQAITTFVIALAACEACVILSIAYLMNRSMHSIDIDQAKDLKE